MTQQRQAYGWGILQLWLNWLLGYGALILLIILSLWIDPLHLPFIAFGMELILFFLIRRNREMMIPSCYIMPFIVSRVLFWTGIVMIVVNFLYSDAMLDLVFDRSQVNKSIPFICVLITSPIAAIISGWGYLNRHNISFCRDCKMRHGTPAERGFLGVIFSQIGQYQIGMLFWISAVTAIAGWSYYCLLYVNEFLNVPDRFVFFLLPTLLWIASSTYLAIRYFGIYAYYRQNVEGSLTRRSDSTQIRFLMICGNRMAVRLLETDSEKRISPYEKIDTPVTAFIHKYDSMNIQTAETYFSNLSGICGVEIHRMYENAHANLDCNIFHFFALLTPDQMQQFDNEHPNCQWLTLKDIAILLNAHKLNPLLSAEITRFHTIASTYKTYDANGRRRYKVKHYHPSADFSDIHTLDVDFNDSHWLYVADNNQDTQFWRMRRFWRRYINGIGQ